MARPNKSESKPKKRRPPPAKTLEGRENQIISAAYSLAEEQILDGTASSTVIVHFLKLGSTREQVEKLKLEKEVELLRAKADNIQSQAKQEELYKEAIAAMKRYNGDRSDDHGD